MLRNTISLIFIGFLLFNCHSKGQLDINKLNKEYFLGEYYSISIPDLEISLYLNDSTFSCSYYLSGKKVLSTGKWFLLSFEDRKQVELVKFPIQLDIGNSKFYFVNSNMNLDLDCNDSLGDLYTNYSGGNNEFRFVKKDKSRNISFLK